MRIQRVVIQGFKTFARKTEFIFDPGITAVVGPNGSGKSNIVDAIRWCLGEQSFSLLRSKKTSDVIFSGSDKKARLGMAEVSLTLDNSAGEIPIDFDEVEITRRAYRDGDNEYLVNSQRVRLQDIVDLLAQTGLGKRTYSVVGQGLIDRALSMAPEERRSLFEEAAGITGYQLKRATALRRLDATQQNLTRVQDIVAELSPRLGYLRRQADRAREREQIARDLQALLRDWYGYRWHTTLRQLAEHHATEQASKAALTARQIALAEVAASIESLRGRQTALRAQLADLHGVGSELHRRAESSGRELAVAQERLRQMQARQEDAQRELAPMRVQQATLTARLTELRAAVAAAQADFAARQQAVDAIQVEVGQRQQERQRLQEAVEAARRGLKRVQDQRTDAASRLTQIDERRAVVLVEQEQQRTALTAAGRDAAAAKAELHAAESGAARVDQHASTLEQEIADLEQRLTGLRGQLRQAEETRQAADRAVDRLQTRHDLLNRLRSEGAGYASGVRAVLQAGAGNKLPGILGTVASLLRVPPHLDKAIETALGGALQNVVAERWADATVAIEFLKQQRGGRATFLPLDRLDVLPAIPAPQQSGILGNAADLVAYDAPVAAAIQQMLNRVWIADNLPAARAALDELGRGPRPTVVTLEGEIVRPGGAVTGGSDGSRPDDSLLARERELRELPAAIEAGMRQARQAAAACADQNAQIEAVRAEIDQRQRMLADLVRGARQERQRLEELRRRLDRAGQTQRWQEERLAQTTAELTTLAGREANLRTSLSETEAQEEESIAALAQAEARLAEAGADELLQELANRRAAAAEGQGHLRSQQTLLENTGRNLQSVADQITAKQQQIDGLQHDSAGLAQQIDQLSRQENEVSREIETLQAQIAPLEAELAAVGARTGN